MALDIKLNNVHELLAAFANRSSAYSLGLTLQFIALRDGQALVWGGALTHHVHGSAKWLPLQNNENPELFSFYNINLDGRGFLEFRKVDVPQNSRLYFLADKPAVPKSLKFIANRPGMKALCQTPPRQAWSFFTEAYDKATPDMWTLCSEQDKFYKLEAESYREFDLQVVSSLLSDNTFDTIPTAECDVCCDIFVTIGEIKSVYCDGCHYTCCQLCFEKSMIMASTIFPTCLRCASPVECDRTVLKHLWTNFAFLEDIKNIEISQDSIVKTQALIARIPELKQYEEKLFETLTVDLKAAYKHDLATVNRVFSPNSTGSDYHSNFLNVIRDSSSDRSRLRYFNRRRYYLPFIQSSRNAMNAYTTSTANLNAALLQADQVRGAANEIVGVKIRCAQADCKFIHDYIAGDNGRADLTCGACQMITCSDCRELIDEDDALANLHTCEDAKLKSIAMLLKHSKPCPRCMAPTQLASGCPQVMCENCHLVWLYDTGLPVAAGEALHAHGYMNLPAEKRRKIAAEINQTVSLGAGNFDKSTTPLNDIRWGLQLGFEGNFFAQSFPYIYADIFRETSRLLTRIKQIVAELNVEEILRPSRSFYVLKMRLRQENRDLQIPQLMTDRANFIKSWSVEAIDELAARKAHGANCCAVFSYKLLVYSLLEILQNNENVYRYWILRVLDRQIRFRKTTPFTFGATKISTCVAGALLEEHNHSIVSVARRTELRNIFQLYSEGGFRSNIYKNAIMPSDEDFEAAVQAEIEA